MNLEVEEDGEVLKARLEDANPAVENALRRAMMARVPTVAVKHLDVVKNESGLFDEDLANRVGLVPFQIPENFEEGDTIHVAVKKEGPGKVKSGDFQTDSEAEPVDDEIDIVTLKENQDLEFEAEAVIGYGRDHAKHQGGTVGYRKEGDDFIFQIESSSGYSNRELINKAVEVLKEDINQFEDQLEA